MYLKKDLLQDKEQIISDFGDKYINHDLALSQRYDDQEYSQI